MEWYSIATILVISWVAFTTVLLLGVTRATRQIPVKKAMTERRRAGGRAIVA